jgi:broad specificity phosphatase PhoE
MLRIYLIRHGETDYNKEGRIQGSIETDLNLEGINQSYKTAKFLWEKQIDFDICFVSPQRRALQSMEIIRDFYNKNNKYFKIIIKEDLREIHCGRWEGKLIKDIEKEEGFLLNQVRTKVDVPYPNGESILDVQKRALNFYQNEILSLSNQKEKNILIVSHGNFLRTLGSVILNLPPEFAIKTVVYNMGISLLEEKYKFDTRYFKVIYWNLISYL